MFSIIIPTYNEEKIIEATLGAVAATLTLPHEIIISDGGSTDRTVALAAPYAAAVVVHSGSSRQTIARGRNDGAKAAAPGDFYIFLDADCTIPEPDRFFARALSRFEEDPKLVALTAPLRVIASSETLGDKIVHGLANVTLRVSNNLFNRGHSWGEFQMIRQDAFIRLGGFREDLVTTEDADMFRRLSKIGRTRLDPQLRVLHSGRRSHQVGWPRLIFMWLVNSIFFSICNRSFTKEWTVIR